LTATGITVFMTTEVTGSYPDVRFTTEKVSFITDDIIVQRFVEIAGELRRVLAVVKMRGSEHSQEFRTYEVTSNGAVIGGPLRNYHGIITGMPDLRISLARPGYAGLTDREAIVLDALVRLGTATSELLAARVGMPSVETTEMLERLEALGYAAVTDGRGTYRALAQLGG
jgi:hypothetical protein